MSTRKRLHRAGLSWGAPIAAGTGGCARSTSPKTGFRPGERIHEVTIAWESLVREAAATLGETLFDARDRDVVGVF
ncbi:MAG: hypothetical protein ABSA12_09840 [Verrucomicrobiia bacterium]